MIDQELLAAGYHASSLTVLESALNQVGKVDIFLKMPVLHIWNLVELSFLHSWICLKARQGAQLEIASTGTGTNRSPINNTLQIELGVGRGAPE